MCSSDLSLGFLLAVIDSWDGTEVLEVLVDGVTIFSNTFQLASGDSSSYVAPPGALLSSGTDLGFLLDHAPLALSAQDLVDALKPLQPRLYSISSSPRRCRASGRRLLCRHSPSS